MNLLAGAAVLVGGAALLYLLIMGAAWVIYHPEFEPRKEDEDAEVRRHLLRG